MSDSGAGEKLAAPYQRLFTSLGATADMLAQSNVPAVLPSGAVVKATGSGNLVWQDDSDTTTTLPLVAGDIIDLPFAVRRLLPSTITGWVLFYWHPTGAAARLRIG
jgi:hypothetical protein